jgi:XTP/dITP diphosphohydrolase
MEIIFASANAHKIEEIGRILPANFLIKGLRDIGITDEIPETGATIKENSHLKAKFVYDHVKEKMAVFADDSGLEVDALDGRPGVHSARYAGMPKDDAANNRKLLDELKNVTKRNARFVTVITLILNGEAHCFEGEIKGTIAYEPRGESGFGYDPLFIPQGYRSTFAELGSDVKNSISHRSMAVKGLMAFLEGVEQ